jgi:hypothetical protein
MSTILLTKTDILRNLHEITTFTLINPVEEFPKFFQAQDDMFIEITKVDPRIRKEKDM